MKVVSFRNGAAKLLLVVCFVMCAGSVFAQHRYFCELKSVENNASSSMYVIFDFGTRSSYNLLGVDNDKTVVDEKGWRLISMALWTLPITWQTEVGPLFRLIPPLTTTVRWLVGFSPSRLQVSRRLRRA